MDKDATSSAATLSVIIITKNEAKNIEACLKSVSFADEIIVFDSGSTDSTVSLCQQYTKKVFSTDWPGFGPQKQRALNIATCDWVLSLDADERVSEALKSEILAVIKAPDHESYWLPRQSYVCQIPVKKGGWYPDYIRRLFKRGSGEFSKALVHEEVLVTGESGYLKTPITHYSYENLDSLVEKFNQYTTLGAEELFKKGRSGGLTRAVIRAFVAFTKLYVFKFGFLDGRIGFIVAVSSAETAYYKYLKLYFLKEKRERES